MKLSFPAEGFARALPARVFKSLSGCTLLATLLLSALLSHVANAQPFNDNFSGAPLIENTRGTDPGSNLGATAETGEPANQGGTVWWCWSAPIDGEFVFSTAGSSFNTILCIFTGVTVSTLTHVVCDDDGLGVGGLSRATFVAVAGTTYWIRVDGAGGATGDILLNWASVIPPPVNDNFADATPINGSTGSVTGSNLGASVELLEPENFGGTTVWWRWTAPARGVFDFTTEGSTFDTVLCVYTGQVVNALSQVGCDDDGLGIDNLSRLEFTAESGAIYYIRVEGLEGAEGDIRLNWFPASRPSNDNFTNAIVIGGSFGEVTGTNLGASGETNEPPNFGSTVWWRWLAPSDGMFTFQTAGSEFDTVLCVFTGNALASLNQVTCDDNGLGSNGLSRVQFTAAAGVSYYVRVDGLGGAQGNIRLTWESIAPAPEILCSGNILTNTAAGICGTEVSFSIAASGSPTPTVTCMTNGATVVSPAIFPTGTNLVTCVASNITGSSSCSFTITVVDEEPPTLMCPTNLVVAADFGRCDAVVNFASVATDNCTSNLVVNCSPASGAIFILGLTTVSCQTADAAGNIAQCSFTVRVQDLLPPTLVCSGNIAVECATPQGTVVSYNVSASDFCPGNVSVLCSPASGSLFAPGANPVTCLATDAAGNTNGCSFTVAVIDTTPPTVNCSTNLVLGCGGGTGVVATYLVTVTDNCATGLTPLCVPPSGSFFTEGATVVNCQAFDTAGNSNACSFTVTVADQEAPLLQCPSNQVMRVANPNGAVVSYIVSATDNCDQGPSVSCLPSSGSVFPLGTNQVICVAFDDSGNTNSCSFLIILSATVTNQFPVALCSNVVVAAGNDCLANASADAGSFDPDGEAITVSQIPAGPYPIGTNVVQILVVDTSGASNSCLASIVVLDRGAPALACPATIVVECVSPQGTAVPFNVSASDFCSSNVTVLCVPPAGTVFPAGASEVRCVATDDAGNTNGCSFLVNVVDTTPPLVTCSTNLTVSCAGVGGVPVIFNVTATDNCSTNVTTTCVPPSGALFSSGITLVNCQAADTAGLIARCTFSVEVIDNQPPVLTCPTNMVVNADGGLCDALVLFTVGLVDNCDTNSVSNCQPPSGSRFPVGATTVDCAATDGSSNTNACSFTITVVDQEAPLLACAGNQLLSVTNPAGAVVSFTVTATDNCDTNPVVSCEPPSGSMFPLGTNQVMCRVSDLVGNTNSCGFQVVLQISTGNQPPVALCSNVVASAGNGCFANASINAGSFDPDGDSITVAQLPPGPYGIGNNLVTLVVTDNKGASNLCTATVVVVDSVPPTLACPGDFEAAPPDGGSGAVVNFAVTAMDACEGPTAVSCNPPSGSLFDSGVSRVTCRATDSVGNSNECSFTVSVASRFILKKRLGTVRQDFTGLVGMKITVGETPLLVTHLARIFLPGNTGTHRVKIVRGSDQLDVPGSSVDISMPGGTPGEFKYGALPSPVTLSANTMFYVVSEEVRGGDRWFDVDTAVSPAPVATVDGGVFFGSGYPWVVAGFPNHSYGPVDFRYILGSGGGPLPPTVSISIPLSGDKFSAPAIIAIDAAASALVTNVQFFAGTIFIGVDDTTPFSLIWSNVPPGTYELSARALASDGRTATSSIVSVMVTTNSPGSDTAFVRAVSLGALRNDFSGFLGFKLTVGNDPITVTALGRIYVPGNVGFHLVKLVRAEDGSDVPGGGAFVSVAGGQAGEFNYAVLPQSVVLAAGTMYYVVSEEAKGSDHFYDRNTRIFTAAVGMTDASVYSPDGVSWILADGPGQSYGPVDFRYLVGSSPPEPTVQITSPQAGTTFEGPAHIPIQASVSPGVTNVQFFQGNLELGTASSAPFSLVWSNVAPGNYVLTVRATDTNQVSVMSSAVQVSVLPVTASDSGLEEIGGGGGFGAGVEALLSVVRMERGRVQLLLRGSKGTSYLIQSSDDLAVWHPLTVVKSPGEAVLVEDAASADHSRRYYRAVRVR